MASTPTTKSQVQAYQFVLQRMQSALVRRDAVMLHDPMQRHSRATTVGVVLGVVGLLGFLVFGLFRPAPALNKETQIAISKESGQVYVVDNTGPQPVLIPMTNLASARLLWYSKSNPDQVQTGGGGDAAGGTASGEPGQAAGGTPKLVSESALAKYARGRLTGIPDAPDVLPKPEIRIDAQWSVCDTLDLDELRNNQSAENKIETSVIAGVSRGNAALEDSAVLVQQRTGAKKAYLIYKAPQGSKISSATVRAEVDLKDDKIVNALNIKGKQARAVSTALLNSIPEVTPLKAPKIPKQGEKADYVTEANVNVGEVVQTELTGTLKYHVVLEDGFQEVQQTVGDLLRWTYANNKKATQLSPSAISGHTDPKNPLDLKEYPKTTPTTIDANANNAVLCFGWRAENVKEANKAEHTEVTIGSALPGPKDMTAVELNAPGAGGEIIDHFMMLPGKAAVVRASQGVGDFGTGPVHIVTGRGVRYGVPDAGTATALGLQGDFPPAPNQILNLLPQGPQLNRGDANRSYDAIPAPRGTVKDPAQQQK